MSKEKIRKIRKIIIHCSDSPWGDAITIDKWHKERGFEKIGYHYVILNGYPSYASWKEKKYNQALDGVVENGRNLNEIGAHCAGHNSDSVGICLIGVDKFSERQFRSLKKLVVSLMEKFKLTEKDVYPHNYFENSKTCPNFDIKIIWELKDGRIV